MIAVFQNLVVEAHDASHFMAFSELAIFVSENFGCPVQMIKDKADELNLINELHEGEVLIVGGRPVVIRR